MAELYILAGAAILAAICVYLIVARAGRRVDADARQRELEALARIHERGDQ